MQCSTSSITMTPMTTAQTTSPTDLGYFADPTAFPDETLEAIVADKSAAAAWTAERFGAGHPMAEAAQAIADNAAAELASRRAPADEARTLIGVVVTFSVPSALTIDEDVDPAAYAVRAMTDALADWDTDVAATDELPNHRPDATATDGLDVLAEVAGELAYCAAVAARGTLTDGEDVDVAAELAYCRTLAAHVLARLNVLAEAGR